MLKTFTALLSLMLLTTACQSEAPFVVEDLGGEVAMPAEIGDESVELTPDFSDETPAQTFTFSRETAVASGSSELTDDSGYGFAYNAANVFDLDYSTSWCAAGEAIPVLSLTFPEATALGTAGIVPGYARDEKIFFQNNRLKTVEVWYDEQAEAVGELHFEDDYAMQFFTMPAGEVQTVKFKIMETYPGSKYEDTCVAEVDFWSEWVDTEDATAAYNYYLEYKEEFSARPVGLTSLAMTFSGEGWDDNPKHAVQNLLDSCGRIQSSRFETEKETGDTVYYWADSGGFAYVYNDFESGGDMSFSTWSAAAGDRPAISAQMNEWAREGDEVTVKWIDHKLTDLEALSYVNRVMELETLTVKACSDGTLYLSDTLSPDEGLSYWGSGVVQLYFGDRLIGWTDFSLAQ